MIRSAAVASRLVSAVTLLLASGCVSSRSTPAFTQEPSPVGRDEQQLWREAAMEQQRLDESGFVVSLPETEAYLNGVLVRLGVPGAGIDASAPLRVRIVVDPTFNAFAMPHGALYVHTGLLARLQDEAQVATILAHEAGHVTLRHGVRQWRQFKVSTAWLATLTVGTGGYGSLLGAFGAAAAVTGYSRDLEREADAEGFARLRQAGYDTTRAPEVFRMLLAERKRSKLKEPFFFGSHPKLQERIESYTELIAQVPVDQRSGRVGTAEFSAHLPAVLRLDAEAALRVGDFDGSAATLERFAQLSPADPEMAVLRGEWHRKRGEPGDHEEALAWYDKVLAASPDHPTALRGRGLVLGSTGRRPEAAVALRRYLEVAPDAIDRSHLLHLLDTWSPES